jgi:hypothetical protein
MAHDLIYLKPQASHYDAVDFKFIHDDGICIRMRYPTEEGTQETDIDEAFTIGEALEIIAGNIKDADQEYIWMHDITDKGDN